RPGEAGSSAGCGVAREAAAEPSSRGDGGLAGRTPEDQEDLVSRPKRANPDLEAPYFAAEASAAEQVAQPMLGHRRGLGRVHEGAEGIHEPLWPFGVREVAGLGEDLEPAARDRVVRF